MRYEVMGMDGAMLGAVEVSGEARGRTRVVEVAEGVTMRRSAGGEQLFYHAVQPAGKAFDEAIESGWLRRVDVGARRGRPQARLTLTTEQTRTLVRLFSRAAPDPAPGLPPAPPHQGFETWASDRGNGG